MKLFVFGLGILIGVFWIGNDWGDCDFNELKNCCMCVLIMVESVVGLWLLVDILIDLCVQLLVNWIDWVDVIFWMYDYVDYMYGIDDLWLMCYGCGGLILGYVLEEIVWWL